MQRVAKVACACSFYINVGAIFYTGLALEACAGRSSEAFTYTIMSFVIGWTAFLCAVSTLPDNTENTFCATIPIIGMAVWGLCVIYFSAVEDTRCVRARTVTVGFLCLLQLLELCFFCMYFICAAFKTFKTAAIVNLSSTITV